MVIRTEEQVQHVLCRLFRSIAQIRSQATTVHTLAFLTPPGP